MYLRIYYTESKLINTLSPKRQTSYESFNNTINNTITNSILTEINPPDRIIKFNDSEEANKNESISNSNSSGFFINDSSLINNYNNGKIGVAFVYKSPFGNGIGRFLSLLCSELSKSDIYDIYLISGPLHPNIDFHFDEKVIIHNRT